MKKKKIENTLSKSLKTETYLYIHEYAGYLLCCLLTLSYCKLSIESKEKLKYGIRPLGQSLSDLIDLVGNTVVGLSFKKE